MNLSNLPLYLSAPHPCSYLEGHSARTLFLDPAQPLPLPLYSQLLDQGFRRSGGLVYRPHCADCQQCLSVRLPVERFAPRRRHRRVLRSNRAVSLHWRDAGFDPEHFDLYRRYIASRHPGGSMDNDSAAQYREFLWSAWSNTRLLELREHGQLLGVAVTDRIEQGYSAIYTFFDPIQPQRSLGTLAVLSQIRLAAEAGLPYLYLGYWIRDCNKMAYKADFRPLQLFSQGEWREFDLGQAVLTAELR